MLSKLKGSLCVILVLVIIVTVLTSCGSKKPQVIGTSSLGYDDTFASINSTADGYTVYNPGNENKLVTAQLLDQNNKPINQVDLGGYKVLQSSYNGKMMKFTYDIHNYSDYPKNVNLYIIAWGTDKESLQPFRVAGKAGEQNDYTVTVPTNTDKKLGFSLDPLVANTDGAFYTFDTSVENTGYSADGSKNLKVLDFSMLIKSTAKAYVVDKKQADNVMGNEYDIPTFDIVTQYGVALSTPSNGALDTSKFQTQNYAFNNNDQICLLIGVPNSGSTTQDNVKQRGFLMIDNKFVKAFNGKYYFDDVQKMGKYYEINIDKSVMPSSGTHTLSFMAYGDMESSAELQFTIKK